MQNLNIFSHTHDRVSRWESEIFGESVRLILYTQMLNIKLPYDTAIQHNWVESLDPSVKSSSIFTKKVGP